MFPFGDVIMGGILYIEAVRWCYIYLDMQATYPTTRKNWLHIDWPGFRQYAHGCTSGTGYKQNKNAKYVSVSIIFYNTK